MYNWRNKTSYKNGYYSNWIKWGAMKKYCKENGSGLLITDGDKTITDLNHVKVCSDFKIALFDEFKKHYKIQWGKVCELKEEYKVTMYELACLAIQEKIKWYSNRFEYQSKS